MAWDRGGEDLRGAVLGPAGEGPRCLPKVSAWRHGASSEGHAAVSASCLSLCDGSIERWPVTMSKPPRAPPPHPGHTHLPRVLGAGAPDVQPASERGEGALQWARLAPHSRLGGTRGAVPAPSRHQTLLHSSCARRVRPGPAARGHLPWFPGPKDAPFVACHLCVIVLTWLQALPLCQISTATPGK